MSRHERLLRLMHVLRAIRSPFTAERLARETGVSMRSIYRDIDSLRSAGVRIEGERGVGYRLVEDGTLPPQTFSRIEIEALVLGLSQVRQAGDPALAQAADGVLGKIAGSLPSAGQQQMLHAVSRVHRFHAPHAAPLDLQPVREACWREVALAIRYADRAGAVTDRVIWPLAIVYVDRLLVVLAWCCLREDFRMFRTDRLLGVEPRAESFRPRRARLLREYLAQLDAAKAPPPAMKDATGAG